MEKKFPSGERKTKHGREETQSQTVAREFRHELQMSGGKGRGDLRI